MAMAQASKKQLILKPIVAVGFKIKLPENINDLLKYTSDSSKYEIPREIHCGVFYNECCRGGLQDVHQSQEYMEKWYKQRKGIIYTTYIKQIHIIEKPSLIVTNITIANDRAYAFLSNMKNVATTQFKKGINNGKISGIPVKTIDLKEPIKVECSVYIY